MEQHVIGEIKISIEGLYKSGYGWLNEDVHNKWREYLEKRMKGRWYYWEYYVTRSMGFADKRLVCQNACVCLHPELIHAYIPLYKVTIEDDKEGILNTPAELVKIITEIVDFCGGSMNVDFYHIHSFSDNGTVTTTTGKLTDKDDEAFLCNNYYVSI